MSYRKDRAFYDNLDDAIDGNGDLQRLLKPAKLPLLKSFLFWPIELIGAIRETLVIRIEDVKDASTLNPVAIRVVLNSNKVFWETGLWFLLLIAINYALLFKNGEFRWQQVALITGVA